MGNIRNVILHYHIFKNAGSTIDAILKKNFPSSWGAVEGKPQIYRLYNEDLLKYILGNKNIVAISSHEARPSLPNVGNLAFYPILFLRHPIDRIGSIYSYRRSLPEITTPSTKIAKEMDITGYIRFCLANPNAETIINFQTTYLSSSEKDLRKPPEFEAALQKIREFPFFGLVERFDESIMLLRDYLLGTFGKLDLSYTVANKSQGRNGSIETRIKNIESALGPDLYLELLEKNALDLELYNQAAQIFTERSAA